MKTIFLAIAFGTSVRDVLRNDTYRVLTKSKNLRIVIFSQDISDNFTKEFKNKNVFFEKIDSFRPTLTERMLLHFHRATLRKRCRTIDLGNTSGEKTALNFFTPIANLFHFFIGIKKTNRFIYFLYQIFARRNDYIEKFKKYNPDLVVVTRVLNYSADYPIMRTADYLKIPVIALVSSWDNLTSKAFFPFSLRRLIVWNNVLKNEAISLFDFPKNKISVTGIPRYDLFFRKKDFKSKTEFYNYWKINKNHKLITYCTGSKTTGKSRLDPITPEVNISEFIANKCSNGELRNVSLIVRLHPQANPNHYHKLSKMDNVILNIPGNDGLFQDRTFSLKEDIEFGEMMMHSDVVINFASTVSIDAAVFNTPVVCVNFDFNGIRPYSISPKRIYEFDHYAKLLETGGVTLSESKDDLIDDIKRYLNNPKLHDKERKNIVNQQCFYKDGNSGKRNAKIILNELHNL